MGATALNPVVTTIIQLGSVPLLLKSWGAPKYGDWLILSAIPSYLSLTNLGFGDASGSDMTVRVAAGDYEGAVTTFQSSWALLAVASLAVTILAIVACGLLPCAHLLHLQGMTDLQAGLVIVLLGMYAIVIQHGQVIESGFRCDGNFALGTATGTMLRLFEAVVATAVALVSGSLAYCALAYLLARTLGTVAYAMLLKRKSPWLPFGLQHAKLDVIKALFKPAVGFVALPLGYSIGLQGTTILIGTMLGPVAVATFSTLRTLTRLGYQVLNMVGWTIWPEMSRAFGERNIKLARYIHRRAYKVGLALSLAIGIALWYAGPFVFRFWINGRLPFDSVCFQILLLVTFASSLWFTSSIVPMSTNTHHPLALAFVTASVFSLMLSYFLLPRMGLKGAAVALLVTDLLMIVIAFRTALKQLDDNFAEFCLAMLRPGKNLV